MAKARFGHFEADLQARELRKGGIRIKIHEQPFQILEALLERPGEIVTREELRQRVWADNTFVDFDQSLNKAINRVRAALGDNAANPRFIETLSRRGYRLLVPVERPEAPAPAVAFAVTNSMRSRRKSLPLLCGGTVAAVAAIAGAITLWPTAKPSSIRSLVVLPLTNLSGHADQDYFADGVTEAITTELASIPGLRVVSTTTAMQYKRNRKSLPGIARALGVDAVIEGSLLRTGDRVRVLLKLIEAESERPLWAETYDMDVADILRLQDDVVRLVAAEIRVQVNPQRRRQAARRVDPAALDHYLKGYSLAQLRTEQALHKSIEHFQQAIAVDPDYARAYVALGNSYALLIAYHLIPSQEAYRRLKAAATRAIELDETLGEAHMLLAGAKLYSEWDWPAAEKLFRHTLQLNPSSAVARQRYGGALAWMGRSDEALAEIRWAQELDPLSLTYRINEGQTYYHRRDFRRATELLRQTVERDPKHFNAWLCLGLSYVAEGIYDEGVRAMRNAVALAPGPHTRSSLAYALAKSGRKEEALGFIGELESGQLAYGSAYNIAVVYAGLGDKDRAFEWLNKGYEERSRYMMYLRVDPVMDNLRSDPRFAALLNKVGLGK
jgi:TolB-like protein/DNA-binding winged helix-turn-helix (wHTH) protein/Flp pilus assembly protein TadD